MVRSSPAAENTALRVQVLKLQGLVQQLESTIDAQQNQRAALVERAWSTACEDATATLTDAYAAIMRRTVQLLEMSKMEAANADMEAGERVAMSLLQRLKPFLQFHEGGIDLLHFWRLFGSDSAAPWHLSVRQLTLFLSVDLRSTFHCRGPRETSPGFFELVLSQLPRLEVCTISGGDYRFDAELLASVPQPFASLQALKLRGPLPTHEDAQQLVQLLESCCSLQEVHFTHCVRLRNLSMLSQLSNLVVLSLVRSGVQSLSFLEDCLLLEELHLSDTPALDLSSENLRHVELVPKLKRLHMDALPLTNLSWISTCTTVEDLSLARCRAVKDFSPLQSLYHLKKLNLSSTRVSKISWISEDAMPHLVEFHASDCLLLTDLTPLSTLPKLLIIIVDRSGCRHVDFAADCTECLHLSLAQCPQLTRGDGWTKSLTHLSPSLINLNLRHLGVRELHWLVRCPMLTELYLSYCHELSDLSAVAELPVLQKLYAYGTSVQSIDWIVKCPTLEEVSFGDCRRLRGVQVLAQLPRLKKVYLESNPLADCTWMEACWQLEEVSLDNCGNVVDLSALGHMPRLRKVWAGGTGVTDLAWVPHCHGLEELYIPHCTHLKDLSTLSTAKRLRCLYAYYTPVEDIEWIVSCVELQELSFGSCTDIEDFTPISALFALRKLWLDGTLLPSIEWVAGCPALEEVFLSRCPLLQDFSPLDELPHLRQLHAQGTRAGNLRWVAGCPQLEELNLSHCTRVLHTQMLGKAHCLRSVVLSGTGITTLTPLTHCSLLEEMDLSNCAELSNTAMADVALFRGLRKLWIGDNTQLTDVSWLRKCTLLEEFYAGGCTEVADFSALGGSTSRPSMLTRVSFYHTGVKDIGWISTCTSLEEVSIGHTPHLEKGLIALGMLPQLDTLGADGSCLSEDWILACTHLEEIHMSQCSTGDDIRLLAELPGLRRLYLNGSEVDDITWIAQCPVLEELNINDCAHIQDLHVLGRAPLLRKIFASGTVMKDVEWIEKCLSHLEEIDLSRTNVLMYSKFGSTLDQLRRNGVFVKL